MADDGPTETRHRRRRGILIAGLLFVTFASLGAVAYFAELAPKIAHIALDHPVVPSSAQPPEPQAEHSASAENKPSPFWERTTEDPIAAFTALLFVATCFLAYMTFRADRTAGKSADAALISARAALKTAQLTEAALIDAKKANVLMAFRYENEGSPGSAHFAFYVLVKNLGPHLADILHGMAASRADMIGFGPYPDDVTPLQTTCAAGDFVRIARIIPHQTNRFYWGYVTYRDGLGVHELRFCVEYRRNPPDGQFTFIMTGDAPWNERIDQPDVKT